MKRYRFILQTIGLFLGCLFFTASFALAQQKVSSSLIKQDTTKQSIDTVSISGGTVQFAPPEQKSGTKAMLLSALLPGAGQIYAHRYYTIPIIWGYGLYCAYTWNDLNNQYHYYANMFSESVRLDTSAHIGDSRISGLRDQYHDQRDEFAIYLALTYILNIVDAYVAATLYSFDVSSELGPATSTVRFKIPLR
jgi:Family of unknown function (DUF5683)